MEDSRLEPTGIPNGAIEIWQVVMKVVMKAVDRRGYCPEEKVPLLDVTDYRSAERVAEDCFPTCGKTSFLI